MTDYTAHDIHRLDQAYPDALSDIEAHTGNPVHKRRLAEVGPEVYAAELTRDFAFSFENPMSLAGWAAIATVRLMDAGKAWEEDTDLAYEQRDAARADADKLRAQVAELADQLHKANAGRDSAIKRIDGIRDYILGAVDEELPLTPEEMRNAAIDLGEALADLGCRVNDNEAEVA